MKTLLFLLLMPLCITTVRAQDTAKRHLPKPNAHQLLQNFIKGPQAVERYREHQDSLIRPNLAPDNHHPAVYIDGELGYAFVGVHGFENSFSVNYQGGAGLFTLKGLNISSFRNDDNPYLKNRLIIFDDIEANSLDQLALLYGKRLVDMQDQQALNFSAGIAVESRYFYSYTFQSASSQTRYQHSTTYPGVPVMVNWQLFSRRLGASFNLRLSGDISRYSFASLGVALGLGYHYKN